MYSPLPGAKKSSDDLPTHSSASEMTWWWIGLSVNCPQWCRLAQQCMNMETGGNQQRERAKTWWDCVTGIWRVLAGPMRIEDAQDRDHWRLEINRKLANPWKNSVSTWELRYLWPTNDHQKKYDKYSRFSSRHFPHFLIGLTPDYTYKYWLQFPTFWR